MENEAVIENPQPPETRGGTLRWGGIFAGLIIGYVSLMILVSFGLTIGLVIVAAGPHRLVGLLIGGGVWLLAAHAIAAYLAGRTTAGVAPYATDAQRRLNALITGMLMLLVMTFYSFSSLFGYMSVVGGAVSSIAGMFGGGSKSLTSWAPEQAAAPRFVTHAGQSELSLAPAEPVGRVEPPAVELTAAAPKAASPTWEENLPRWLMPVVRRVAGISATLMGAWLVLAAVLLSFAVIGGVSAHPAPATAPRPVQIHRQRAPTPGA